MSTKHVTLPSGLAGNVRGLKLGEQKILTDKKAISDGTYLGRLLAACWVETTTPGPYRMKSDGNPSWGEVYQGDRADALVAIRCATHGEAFDFDFRCEACERKVRMTLDLETELPRVALSPEAVAQFATENRFEVAAPDGEAVAFKLMTGADEEALASSKLGKLADSEPLTVALAARIISVDGDTSLKFIRAWLDNLGWAEAMALIDAMDGVAGGGIDTKIEVACNHCDEVQKIDLPFGAGFLFPKKVKR